MHQSVMLTSLPLEFEPAVRQAAALGFTHVDPIALAERPASHCEALADTGMIVSCMPLGRGLPEGQTLDAASVGDRRAALETMKRQVADAARLGATHCYLIPGLEPGADALARYSEAAIVLADFAVGRRMKLCVEHIPGRALPTGMGTLSWLDQLGHENLFLLLDIGHCLISGEEPAAVLRTAGNRLGYIHFDDNDGVGDLHWPLLSGKLTEPMLRETIGALQEIGYRNALCLELNAGNDDPLEALRRSKVILDGLLK